MRSAPPVQVVVGADPGWRIAASACGAAAGASLVAWLCLMTETSTLQAAAGATLAALAAGWWSWHGLAAPAGLLSWDGTEWRWCGRSGEVDVVIDLGPWLLLQFTPAGARAMQAAHLPVSAAGARAGWHGLRTAVYSRRPEPRTPSAPRM